MEKKDLTVRHTKNKLMRLEFTRLVQRSEPTPDHIHLGLEL